MLHQRVDIPTMMSYAELRRRMDAARPEVLRLVVAAEARLAAEQPLSALALPPGAERLPFSARVWDAWAGNTAKLRGVKRLDDAPYATHPTRMALFCYWLLPPPAREDAAVLALLHDYLEEGDGFSPAALVAMRRRFPTEEAARFAAVLLSEPEIPYARLGPERERWPWKRVAYVVQAAAAVRRPDGQRFADAALTDKLDNLHDLGYIEDDPHLTREKRAEKLAVRLGYFRFVADVLGDAAEPGLGDLIRDAVSARAVEMGVPEALVAIETAGLAARRAEKAAEIERLIGEYHGDIELRRL